MAVKKELQKVDAPVMRRIVVQKHEFNIQTHLRYDGPYGEENTKPSLTIPGQALDVVELIKRQDAGMQIPNTWVPFYDENEPVPDFRTMDLSELGDLRDILRARMEEIRAQAVRAQDKRLEDLERTERDYKELLRITEEKEKTKKNEKPEA